MTGYTLANAVADRDEAYRLLHAAYSSLDAVDKIIEEAHRDEWGTFAMYSGVKAMLR